MEPDETRETVHKAKCFGEPAELMHGEFEGEEFPEWRGIS